MVTISFKNWHVWNACLFCRSDGQEVSLHDNVIDLFYQLKYEADLLFTRWELSFTMFYFYDIIEPPFHSKEEKKHQKA